MIWWTCGPDPARPVYVDLTDVDPAGGDDPDDALVHLVREWFEEFADADTSVAVRTGRAHGGDGSGALHLCCCVRHHRDGAPPAAPPVPAVPERPGEHDVVIAVRRVGEIPGAVCEALVADAPSTFLEIRLDRPVPAARPAVVDLRTPARRQAAST